MREAGAGRGEFAALLRRLRGAAALSQDELAARAGLTAKAVSALERGERRRPHPHTVRALADALGLDPAARAELSAATRPAPTAPVPVTHPVPAPPAPVVGRDAERGELAGLLRSGATRLLTLTGPGGVGKTSLALDLARTVAADFPDGVTVVELAAVPEARLVLPTVARALGAPPAGDLLGSLAALLGSSRRLLVLDNLEHLLDAAADVAALLARCPGLVVLATSRAPLRVRAEQDRPVQPLALPTGPGTAAVAASPAARLFLDRARATGRAVALTDDTAADVAAICRRLDGLPLALELAAAHARLLSPAALLARLDQALASPRSRDLPERQRTMRATLDWSHALLTHDEQVLLRRLSVFAGGFSLAAAEEVAGVGGDVLPALAGLVEQSLVLPVEGGDPRHRLLEPVRQYAADRLAEAGETGAVADRAADRVVRLAAAARAGLRTSGQARELDRLQAEHGNLAAALSRLVAGGRPGTAAVVGADTWLYWALRGNVAEGRSWMEQALRAAGAALAPAELAALHLALAALRFASGDVPGTAGSADAAARAAQVAGADELRGEALVLAASAAVFVGDDRTATDAVTEATRLGRATGARWVVAHAVTAQAQLLFRAGDLPASAAVLDHAEQLARELASPFTLATVLNVQASVALAAGDDDAALDRWTEAAGLAVAVGTTWPLAYTVPGLAVVAARRGLPGLAAELFAAGSARAEAASVAVTFPPDLESARHWLSAVRTELGEVDFARAWARGRGLRPDDVPALAGHISARRGPD
ncbi:XRE family transcriptional regulator [Geodermatophilus sabuli]|uniref:XRE family transcriptional regulator n=1 Tax=Geodermatophilus sabuli TaxID=1564158 RepID=A0A7K3VV65_9ACTN|nr:XRE family transcriptional regulator [Geodermatophilus sabuli]